MATSKKAASKTTDDPTLSDVHADILALIGEESVALDVLTYRLTSVFGQDPFVAEYETGELSTDKDINTALDIKGQLAHLRQRTQAIIDCLNL